MNDLEEKAQRASSDKRPRLEVYELVHRSERDVSVLLVLCLDILFPVLSPDI